MTIFRTSRGYTLCSFSLSNALFNSIASSRDFLLVRSTTNNRPLAIATRLAKSFSIISVNRTRDDIPDCPMIILSLWLVILVGVLVSGIYPCTNLPRKDVLPDPRDPKMAKLKAGAPGLGIAADEETTLCISDFAFDGCALGCFVSSAGFFSGSVKFFFGSSFLPSSLALELLLECLGVLLLTYSALFLAYSTLEFSALGVDEFFLSSEFVVFSCLYGKHIAGYVIINWGSCI